MVVGLLVRKPKADIPPELVWKAGLSSLIWSISEKGS